MRRRFRTPTTRDLILEELKRATLDTLRPPRPRKECKCHDCRLARATDVSENPRILLCTDKQWEAMRELCGSLKWNHDQLSQFTVAMFGKQPSLLREIEAAAILAHMERGDV